MEHRFSLFAKKDKKDHFDSLKCADDGRNYKYTFFFYKEDKVGFYKVHFNFINDEFSIESEILDLNIAFYANLWYYGFDTVPRFNTDLKVDYFKIYCGMVFNSKINLKNGTN